ncbi:MAG: glutamate racemase [Clostridiales bacterium]|nr:glutamate racemase [Clostridiales bacterium]
MADNRPIGVFDSGIGGLTVLREIIAAVPGESTIYFGDDGRSPYGTKSHETIIKYSLQDMLFLKEQDVKMIVIACNTASTHAYETLASVCDVPVVEVVVPGARAAVEATSNGRIGIIATRATISSGVYESAVLKAGENIDGLKVISQACPLFVSLAEEGWWDNEVAYLTACDYLKPLKEAGVDTVVLACTHYPLLAPVISRVMGPSVKLINSGVAVAGVVKSILSENKIESDGKDVTRSFFTSDDPKLFEQVAAPFLGRGLPSGTRRVQVDNIDVKGFL